MAPGAVVAMTAVLCVYGIATGLIGGVSGQGIDENVLDQGGALAAGDQLKLGNVYSFIMEDDCNLVLRHTGVGKLWESGTAGQGTNCFFILQADGNGVIYKDNSFSSPVWSTGTCCRGDGDHYIIVQADGNTCMYNYISPNALWATETRGRL